MRIDSLQLSAAFSWLRSPSPFFDPDKLALLGELKGDEDPDSLVPILVLHRQLNGRSAVSEDGSLELRLAPTPTPISSAGDAYECGGYGSDWPAWDECPD